MAKERPQKEAGNAERISQSDMPRFPFSEALLLAKALKENFASKGTSPINLARAIKRSPSSSAWRILTGAAMAYGLTNGGYNASEISLADLGDKIVNPTQDGEDSVAMLEATLRPSILKTFYERYDRQKLPKGEIGKNVLRTLGVPQERTDEAWKIVIENAKLLEILTDVNGEQYVQLWSAKDELGKSHASLKREEQNRPSPSFLPAPVRQAAPSSFHVQPVGDSEISISIPHEWNANTPIHDDLLTLWGKFIQAGRAYADKYREKYPERKSPNSKEPEGS